MDNNNGLATNSNSKDGVVKSSVYSEMLRWQLIATVAVVLIASLISGVHAGFSSFIGGSAVIIAAFIASKIAQRNVTDASAILVNLLKAEAVKVLVIVVLLFITFKVYKQLVPFALIAGLAAAAFFSGAAISKLNDDNV